MGKKGRDSKRKRQSAPAFWQIERKKGRFVPKIKPGPHPSKTAYPLGLLLRDVLRLVTTMHEAKKILNAGKVKVDGLVKREFNFAVGLMDVIDTTSLGKTYRFVPRNSKPLVAIALPDSERDLKLVKVTSKRTIKNKKIQYGFHDGKSIVSDKNMKVGDSCLMKIPQQEITNHIKFERGSQALIIRGENAGKIGQIEDIREGIFSLPTRTLIAFEDRSVELPVSMVMAIGTDKPVIKVS